MAINTLFKNTAIVKNLGTVLGTVVGTILGTFWERFTEQVSRDTNGLCSLYRYIKRYSFFLISCGIFYRTGRTHHPSKHKTTQRTRLAFRFLSVNLPRIVLVFINTALNVFYLPQAGHISEVRVIFHAEFPTQLVTPAATCRDFRVVPYRAQ